WGGLRDRRGRRRTGPARSCGLRFRLLFDLDLLPPQRAHDPLPQRQRKRGLPREDPSPPVLVAGRILFALYREPIQRQQPLQVLPVFGIDDATRLALAPQNAFHGFTRFW